MEGSQKAPSPRSAKSDKSLLQALKLTTDRADRSLLRRARLAADWCDYLEHHARKLYVTELCPELTTAHLIASKIRTEAITDEMHVREIYRHQWSGLTVPEVVLDGFRMLEGCNMVRIDRKETLGRPADVIQLHPSLKGAAT